MEFRRDGICHIPIFVTEVDEQYIVAAYQGRISEFDILIKYRQIGINSKWSRIRTPKHIHWAADIMIKMHHDKDATREFIDKLIALWESTSPLKTTWERKRMLSVKLLLNNCQAEFEQYQVLGEHGEYSLNFLILLAKLLMLQEKTNLETAFMFKDLLKALKSGEDLFRIVSIATHR